MPKTQFAITAKNISGSIWNGKIDGLYIGPAYIGPVDARLKFFPLLMGQANLTVKGPEHVSGHIISGWGHMEFRDMEGEFSLPQNTGPLPFTQLELRDVSVKLAQGDCTKARGNIRLHLSPQFADILKIRGGFFGSLACQNGAVTMALTSQSAMERIDIHIMNGHEHRVMMTINDPEPNLVPVLTSAGFTATADGYQLSVRDKF